MKRIIELTAYLLSKAFMFMMYGILIIYGVIDRLIRKLNDNFYRID
jgi:hypothetical protein